jgi:hypothetical protein
MALDNNDKDNVELSLDDKMHKAITARFNRLNLDEVISKAVEAALQRHSQPTAVVQESVSDVKVKDSRDDEIAKLRKEFADKEAKSLAKIVAQHEKQAMLMLKSELKGKVIPDMDDVVAEWMFNSKKMISTNEEGEAFMAIGDEKLPIAEGVAKFLKSKDAKRFVPAVDATRAVVKPVLDRPAPSGSPLQASDTLDVSARTNAVLANMGLK